MMLTWKVRYAVVAIVDMAEIFDRQIPVKLKDISDRQNISITYLEQLFLKLKHHNIVVSKKGPGGGYILSKMPKDITILDIVNAVDEAIKMNGCNPKADHGCLGKKNAKCNSHYLWAGLNANIQEYLSSFSVQDVINQNNVINSAMKLGTQKLGAMHV